jgi:hypothetical protein
MSEPARKLTAAELEGPRATQGGPPSGGAAIDREFVLFLCELFRDWEKDQDPSKWTSADNE